MSGEKCWYFLKTLTLSKCKEMATKSEGITSSYSKNELSFKKINFGKQNQREPNHWLTAYTHHMKENNEFLCSKNWQTSDLQRTLIINIVDPHLC